MHKDESRLINTLAHESEKVLTKDNFFNLSTIKEADDMNVSAWNDTKTLTGFNFFPSIVSHAMRSTNIDTFSKIRLDRSPDTSVRIKLSHDRSKSISLTRGYKGSTFPIAEAVKKKYLNHSNEKKPIFPTIKRNAILSMYLPHKARKKLQTGKMSLATVDDLLPFLQPVLNNTITRKVITTLRSKADLNRTLSKQQFNKKFHKLSV